MSQPIVVVAAAAEPEPAETPSADFAAGAATVVAAAAADAAVEATAEAEAARDVARDASSTAFSAELAVADAEGRIDRIEEFLEDLVGVLNEELPESAELPAAPAVDDGAPPPADTVVEEPTPPTTEVKAKRQRSGKWGSDGWFGSRD